MKLFTGMIQGDCKIKNISDKIILMVGASRIGKSAAWNWLMKNKLVGYNDPNDEYNIYYEVENKQGLRAEMSPNMNESITTIPNIGKIRLN